MRYDCHAFPLSPLPIFDAGDTPPGAGPQMFFDAPFYGVAGYTDVDRKQRTRPVEPNTRINHVLLLPHLIIQNLAIYWLAALDPISIEWSPIRHVELHLTCFLAAIGVSYHSTKAPKHLATLTA